MRLFVFTTWLGTAMLVMALLTQTIFGTTLVEEIFFYAFFTLLGFGLPVGDRRRHLALPALRHRPRDQEGRRVRGPGDPAVRDRGRGRGVRLGAGGGGPPGLAGRDAVRWRGTRHARRARSPGCHAGSRTASSTAAGPIPTRCWRASPIGWAMPTRPTTCCRGWRRSCGRRSVRRSRACGSTRTRRCGPTAADPSDAPGREPIHTPGDVLPEIAGEWAIEVRDRGELLGALSVVMPANDPINPSKERLVGDLAGQAGLVLRNVRLIEDLRSSRAAIVTAQDERARRSGARHPRRRAATAGGARRAAAARARPGGAGPGRKPSRCSARSRPRSGRRSTISATWPADLPAAAGRRGSRRGDPGAGPQGRG